MSICDPKLSGEEQMFADGIEEGLKTSAATIERLAAELSRYQTLHFESGQQLLNEAARAERLEAENARLEKERFKYETCLMLISNDYPGAAGLAKAALASAHPADEAKP